MNNELRLSLMTRWYRMIESQEKPEEYREINAYWAKKLLPCWKECACAAKDGSCCLSCKAAETHMNVTVRGQRVGLTHVHFTLGYPRKDDSDRNMIREIERIVIGEGNPNWGAQKGKKYFVIRLK